MATLATTKRLDESTRDYMALGIWLVVLAGALFLIGYGQSKLMTAGLMLQLTAAYSTFMLCGKRKYGQFVHGLPYAFAFAGAGFLCLAPDFHSPVEASLVFLAVTAMMHASIIYNMRKDSPETGRTACVSEYVT